MPVSIAIIYNQPDGSLYSARNEQAAEEGVLVEAAAVEKALQSLGYLTSKIPLALPKEQAFNSLSNIKMTSCLTCSRGSAASPKRKPRW
jgi:hypothetical protein